MSTTYITEFASVTHLGGSTDYPEHPFLATQAVATSGTSAQSAALNPSTRVVRLHGDGIFSYRVGTNPTAVTTDPRVAASTDTFIGIQPGQTWKIAVITNT